MLKNIFYKMAFFFLHVFKRVYDCAMIGHTQFFKWLGIF